MSLNKWAILTLILLLNFQAFAKEAKSACNSKQIKDFKTLYFNLQSELNYEGKDAKFENNKLSLKEHDSKKPYGGKLFEDALFKEYQNALKKVAHVFQKDQPAPSKGSNKELVDFFKSIRGDTSIDIQQMNFKALIEQLKKASERNGEKKFHITDEDSYLLGNLLIHAQDFHCRVGWLNDGQTSKLSKEDLKRAKEIRQTPLNRMIRALKSLKADSKLELADEKKTISEAVKKHIDDLKKWIGPNPKNNRCYQFLKSHPEKIQAGIQPCNYKKFLESLGDANIGMIEQLLHFINANQKHGKITPKAETGISVIDFEIFTDQAFGDTATSCEPDGSIKNPPLQNKLLDLTKFTCKTSIKGEAKPCAPNSLTLKSNAGNGLKIAPAEKTNVISFSIEGRPSCQNINFSPTQPPSTPPQLEATEAICKAKRPPENFDKEKKICVPVEITEATCKDKKPPENFDKEKKVCVPVEITEATCKEKKPPENFDKEKKVCVPIEITEATCKEKKPPENFDKEKKVCVPVEITEATCKEKKPPENFDKEKKVCVPVEITEATCKDKKPPENFDKEKKVCVPIEITEATCKDKKPPEEFDKEKKICVSISDKDYLDCQEKIAKDVDPDGGRALNNWKWNSDKKTCENRKDGSSPDSDKETPVPDSQPDVVYKDKPVPSRFQPTQIPARQVYILPGMP